MHCGAAFADFRSHYTIFRVGSDDFSHTRVGRTVGGGVEYALTNAVSVRGEYRYSDFGTFSYPVVNIVGGVPGFQIRRRETEQRVQAGVSYKFDTFLATPVVARY